MASQALADHKVGWPSVLLSLPGSSDVFGETDFGEPPSDVFSAPRRPSHYYPKGNTDVDVMLRRELAEAREDREERARRPTKLADPPFEEPPRRKRTSSGERAAFGRADSGDMSMYYETDLRAPGGHCN